MHKLLWRHIRRFLERVSQSDIIVVLMDNEKSWYIRTRYSSLIISKGDSISFLMLPNKLPQP